MTVGTIISIAVLALGSVFALSAWRRQRQSERIREAIRSIGGEVGKLGSYIVGEWGVRREVTYVSEAGDLPHVIARLRRDRVELQDDEPFHRWYHNQHRPQNGTVDLNALMLVVKFKELPGNRAYEEAIRYVARNPGERVVVREGTDVCEHIAAPVSFAAILQCIEASSLLGSDPKPGVLDLVADGKPVEVSWRADGAEPHRMLVLERAEPQGSLHADS